MLGASQGRPPWQDSPVVQHRLCQVEEERRWPVVSGDHWLPRQTSDVVQAPRVVRQDDGTDPAELRRRGRMRHGDVLVPPGSRPLAGPSLRNEQSPPPDVPARPAAGGRPRRAAMSVARVACRTSRASSVLVMTLRLQVCRRGVVATVGLDTGLNKLLARLGWGSTAHSRLRGHFPDQYPLTLRADLEGIPMTVTRRGTT